MNSLAYFMKYSFLFLSTPLFTSSSTFGPSYLAGLGFFCFIVAFFAVASTAGGMGTALYLKFSKSKPSKNG
jgi:hypothetical protein